MSYRGRWWMVWLLVAGWGCTATAEAQTLSRCGKGWLEAVNGALVLHLKGTPYEMGYQHGALLREHVRKNMHTLLVERAEAHTLVEVGPLKLTPRSGIEMILKIQLPFVDQRYLEEMAGVAAGSGTTFHDVRAANFIPEMFHCSGFALANTATKDGEVLHGRVLDYAVDWGLQEHAVLIINEPDGRIPWVNVSYAGFIGSVTGMNSQQISVGEMGGAGLGHWEGRPMALLVREVLETATSLDDAIATFRDGPRTCQYFYVVADGETRESVGMEASWDVFDVIRPGQNHTLLPRGVADCVLLSAGDRYDHLVDKTMAGLGQFTPEQALQLMARPVAMKSNLHNVLFAPKSQRLWVAHATADKRPAAEQPYQEFNIAELLNRRPDTSAPELPFEAKPLTVTSE
jgi:isopenicillin-N N-acyltransferase like protein